MFKNKQPVRDKLEHDENVRMQQKHDLLVSNLKNEKRKLHNKVVALNKQANVMQNEKKSVETELKKQQNSKKYYEDLYKEEREKNIELQKQLKVKFYGFSYILSQKSDKANKDVEQKKSSRPISANKHGRGRTVNLEKVSDQVIDEKVELEYAGQNNLESERKVDIEEEVGLPPLSIKDAENAILTLRFELQKAKINELRPYFKSISITSKEFEEDLQTKFGLSQDYSYIIARYIFQKDAKTYNPSKSMLSAAVIKAIMQAVILKE